MPFTELVQSLLIRQSLATLAITPAVPVIASRVLKPSPTVASLSENPAQTRISMTRPFPIRHVACILHAALAGARYLSTRDAPLRRDRQLAASSARHASTTSASESSGGTDQKDDIAQQGRVEHFEQVKASTHRLDFNRVSGLSQTDGY